MTPQKRQFSKKIQIFEFFYIIGLCEKTRPREPAVFPSIQDENIPDPLKTSNQRSIDTVSYGKPVKVVHI